MINDTKCSILIINSKFKEKFKFFSGKFIEIENQNYHNSSKINPKSGFKRYGIIKNTYMLVDGSIPGPSKRLIRFTNATRPKRNISPDAPSIEYVAHTKGKL